MTTKRTSSTPYAILGLLGLEPMSGYDIRRTSQETLSHFWSESFGQIYPALANLARGGLVRAVTTGPAARGRGGRRVYALTPKGRAALARWRRRSPVERPFRNELLLKLFTSDSRSARDLRPHVLALQRLERAGLAQYAVLRRRIRNEAADHPSRDAWLLTLRYGELRSRAVLKWCAEATRGLARRP